MLDANGAAAGLCRTDEGGWARAELRRVGLGARGLCVELCPHTPLLCLSSYVRACDPRRAQCFVEAAISAGLKLGTRRLDLGKRTDKAMEYDGGRYGNPSAPPEYTLEGACAAARLPPLLPDEVKQRLKNEKTFTSKADVGVVTFCTLAGIGHEELTQGESLIGNWRSPTSLGFA